MLGFHTKQLTERGTETALFDYAAGARDLLGHDVSIYVPESTERVIPRVRDRFQANFEVVFYKRPSQITCDALYVIKKGTPGRVTERIPELNHAFDDVARPHGHRFATVSDWLARKAMHTVHLPRRRKIAVRRMRALPVVPHIVTLPDVTDDFRDSLRIPDDGVVFGRHGGVDTFDVTVAKGPIRAALDARADIWFVFMNTERFVEHERVIHLPLEARRSGIRRFVNTCDYMIHAKYLGETFGLAVAEFAFAGVPVLTDVSALKLGHLELLSDELLLGYRDQEGLLRRLRTLERRREPVKSDVPVRYGTRNVMSRFDEVFLR
jgi:glycosyltransferase involved in cell wall biosynthesis